MTYKVIITGSTGMIGQAVLLECLADARISEILLISRRSQKPNDSKVKELLTDDFSKINSYSDQLKGYDACFHCMGVSAAGMNEKQYTAVIYDLTKSLASTLKEQNPDIIFNYVSGAGTDSTEKGRQMWARVKGRTENLLLNNGFKKALMFRPGLVLPEKGLRSNTKLYRNIYTILSPFNGLLKKSKNIVTSTEFALAMINSLGEENQPSILENIDIKRLAQKG